jgi:hypothetical protein
MKRRTRILAALALFFFLAAGLAVGWQYYPYASSADVCFARNGVAVGDAGDCAGMGRLIAVSAMNPSGDADERLGRCRKRCEESKLCSFYVMRAPSSSPDQFHLQGPPDYYCMLFD